MWALASTHRYTPAHTDTGPHTHTERKRMPQRPERGFGRRCGLAGWAPDRRWEAWAPPTLSSPAAGAPTSPPRCWRHGPGSLPLCAHRGRRGARWLCGGAGALGAGPGGGATSQSRCGVGVALLQAKTTPCTRTSPTVCPAVSLCRGKEGRRPGLGTTPSPRVFRGHRSLGRATLHAAQAPDPG